MLSYNKLKKTFPLKVAIWGETKTDVRNVELNYGMGISVISVKTTLIRTEITYTAEFFFLLFFENPK